jgi:4a-hydroxytetrahydrobiopterin dehydratase
MTWIERDGALHREIRTPDFMTAFRLVEALVPLAEAANHHPDVAFGWGYLRLTLTTHDAGGVTDADRRMAGRMDAILASHQG